MLAEPSPRGLRPVGMGALILENTPPALYHLVSTSDPAVASTRFYT